MQVASRHITIAGVAIQRHRNQIIVGVIADEIDDGNAVLTRALTQAAPQLLCEHNAGLCTAQHDNLVQRRDVDAFIEQIDGEDVVEFARFQPSHSLFTLLCGHLAGQSDGAVRPFRLLVDLRVE